jgi:predicted NAD-dependent protein-ADP-ribosyltransferase YbiA (DUF1768 family)
MKKGLIYKYSQNKNLLEVLLSTGNAKLVESSNKDAYWGGILPNSLNKLGDFQVQLRENYRNDGKIHIEGSGLEPISL